LRREVGGPRGVPTVDGIEDDEPIDTGENPARDPRERAQCRVPYDRRPRRRQRGSERELAPHAVGAAALYAVVTRLDTDDLPAGIDLVEKADVRKR